ncbi:MAG: transposase [Thermoprotei archaeon]|nr:MAG: transposase [Thermoprotei archaeon]RLF24328.1 MAG: transposase [Thermoprotei archaeon]
MKPTRTVKVKCTVSKRNLAILKELLSMYKSMLEYTLNYALKNNIKSFTKLKAKVYRELRNTYPQLPSHYAYTVCQDVSTRIKSFLKLKRKGLTYTDKPEIKRITLWLDDHLWRLNEYMEVKIATHKGWITLGMRPHKLYWKYMNNPTWKLSGEAKLKMNSNGVELLLTFRKEEYKPYEPKAVIPVDINENNITFKVGNEVCMVKTNFKRIIVGYHNHRKRLQEKYQQRIPKLYKKLIRVLREKERKKNIRYQVANLIVKTARELKAIVVLEKLPKRTPNNMISRINSKILKHRIYQASFRGLLNVIIDKCMEYDVPYTLVNPRNTSSTCPICGSRLKPMTGYARRLICPNCNLSMGRDIIAVFNLEKKYLQMRGDMPFTPKLYEVGVKLMNPAQRVKPLPTIHSDTKLHKMKG